MGDLSGADVRDMIQDSTNALPSWLRDSLTTEPEDGVLNKRGRSRHTWTVLARATLLGDTAAKQFLVKTFNVSPDGVGLITRIPLRESADLELVPADGSGEPVRVRVVHCTRTLQGYKVGCELVTR